MIELNKIFTIHKGSRNRRWKAIEHPYFENAFALVSDHVYLLSGDGWHSQDIKHIVGGSSTLEKIEKIAYDHT